MKNKELIKKITNADIPLELVDWAVFEQLKAKEATYVSARDLRSSNGILVSEGFARCQGVGFLDEGCEVGALIHNFPSFDPYYTFTGQWSGSNEYHLEDPKKIFKDMKKVLTVHMYHEEIYEWPERWIEGALAVVGIEKVVHIPIKSKKPGSLYWRHMVQDVKEGSVYIFPTDFEVGIKYSLKK